MSAGKQITIKGFVYEMDFGLGEDKKEYSLFSTPDQGDQYYTLMGPAEFSYTAPDDYNPTAAKLAALERQREEARAEFARRIRELDEQISKLQAIEFDGTDA